MLGISGGKAKQTSPRVDLGLIVTILTKLKTDTFHGSWVFFFFFESGTLGDYYCDVQIKNINNSPAVLFQPWTDNPCRLLLRNTEVVGSSLNWESDGEMR